MDRSIPLTFEVHGDDLRTLLHFETSEGVIKAMWRSAGVAVQYPDTGFDYHDYVDLEEVDAHTAALTLHRRFGYTLGTFSEFFVAPNYASSEDTAVVKVEGVEITLGQVTPLGYHLFAGEMEEEYHGTWDFYQSVRIIGAQASQSESFLLSALGVLQMEVGLSLELINFETPEFIEVDWVEEPRKHHHVLGLASQIADLEPLRLFQRGLSESQSSSAFLHYYRILEFYSIVQLQDETHSLRWDRDISTKDFLKKMTSLIDKDERNLLGRLLSQICDKPMIDFAKKHGLIEQASIAAICAALYEFRNSIVHGKYDQRAAMYVESPFETNTTAKLWAEFCRRIAWNAMKSLGAQLT